MILLLHICNIKYTFQYHKKKMMMNSIHKAETRIEEERQKKNEKEMN